MAEVSEIYQYIADSIVASISEEWQSCVLNIELTDKKSVGYNLNYVDSRGENKSVKLENAFFVSRHLKELHTNHIVGEKGFAKWNKAIFKLSSDHRFEMEFIWDQKMHDLIEFLKNNPTAGLDDIAPHLKPV